MMSGTATAALYSGGTPPNTAKNESWNGSAWTEVGNLNTARNSGAAAGISTSALVFGGTPPQVANTEQWNGSSFTEVADLSTARQDLGGDGVSAVAAVGFGGAPGSGVSNATEEWNLAFATKTIGTD